MRPWISFIIVIGIIVAALLFSDLLIIPSSSFGGGATASKRPNWPDRPFTIGTPQTYAEPGIYFDFADEHGVYIVSHAGMIVALSVNDPVNHRRTRYDDMINKYVEPHRGHRFTSNGLITSIRGRDRVLLDNPEAVKKALKEGKTFPRSLERCYIKLMGERADPTAELKVDPRHRFIQELNQWSRQHSLFAIDKN